MIHRNMNHLLKEAKELSEHKRLIQVLEKERQNMADMQLQAARQTDEMRKSKEMADEANVPNPHFGNCEPCEIRTSDDRYYGDDPFVSGYPYH